MSAERQREDVARMLSRLVHRGPDAEGIWCEDAVALGHRRLSIVDLSPQGSQPMLSRSQRWVLAFNGEIYNHRELRRELESVGESFRGSSDTEVLLTLIEREGFEEALRQSTGMFALAAWDRESRQLYLGRDRCGEKPLYYGWSGRAFLFASELGALTAHPEFRRSVDTSAVAQLLTYSYVPGPKSIYAGVHKLPAGSWLRLQWPSSPDRILVPSSYWSHADALRHGLEHPYEGSFEDAVETLDGLLHDAVGRQMQADVPLGAFLSGGVDSSVVVAMMQRQSVTPVRTFSIGFRESGFDEAPFANAVATHLGTRHTEQYVDENDALDVARELPTIFDEPFADSSQIPTVLVSRLARSKVTVSLSGDGGDEIFYGYPKYQRGHRFSRLPARELMSRALLVARRCGVEKLASWSRKRINGRKLEYLQGLLSSSRPMQLAEFLCRTGYGGENSLLQPELADALSTSADFEADYRVAAMLMDRENYLVDDILVKVDRATMSVSLESRAPLLDHRVIEFASRLPLHYLDGEMGGKDVLKAVLYRYVPRALVERPKAGFSIPLASWLRRGLHVWASDLLAGDDEVLDLAACRKLLERHRLGVDDHASLLWSILAYRGWVSRSLSVA